MGIGEPQWFIQGPGQSPWPGVLGWRATPTAGAGRVAPQKAQA